MARDFFISGDVGEGVMTLAFPDSTLKSALDTAKAAGTLRSELKKFVQWATGSNFQVTPVDTDGDPIQGRIVGIEDYVNSSGTKTYKLTVEWFWYVDAASAKYPATRMIILSYASGGSPSLGNTVAANSTTYTDAKDATSLGAGRIVGIDSTNYNLAVMM